jgi:endonuclease YncB( thermonuclease family)
MKSLSNIVLFALMFPVIANADSFYNVEVVSVYDGDTFKVNLPCEQPMFCKGLSIRVNGIDTPEKKGKCRKEKERALVAQVFTEKFLRGQVNLLDCTHDKYGGRIDCDVVVNGEDLSNALIQTELAVGYHGEKKNKEWCK